MIKTDYDAIADAYARTRRVSEHVIVELQSFCSLTSASRVLEVGCGTAKHIHALIDSAGCAGWGVEPSEGMRRHAPVHARLNVIHHLPSPRKYFEVSFRVLRPGGWICTFTDSTEMIERREPLSRYWPSSAEADIARYPTVAALLDLRFEKGLSLLEEDLRKGPVRVTS